MGRALWNNAPLLHLFLTYAWAGIVIPRGMDEVATTWGSGLVIDRTGQRTRPGLFVVAKVVFFGSRPVLCIYPNAL